VGWSRATGLWAFYVLFAGVGLTQAMTMYEPAFAVIARRYGAEARRGITAVTLWGGFASTVFVPLTQLLVDRFGWRNALLALGACNLAICVGLHAWLVDPRLDVVGPAGGEGSSRRAAGREAVRLVLRRPAFWGLLVAFTVYLGMFVGLTFHLYPMLIERGFGMATIISAIAIIGPAQVAGRIAMWVLGRQRSVRAIGLAAMSCFPVCLLVLILLPSTFATIALFAAVYGAVNGIATIVRGLAVPEMITREAYGSINGLLAMPANMARAVAPAATAALWAIHRSYDLVLGVALAASLVVVAAFAFAALSQERGVPAAAGAAGPGGGVPRGPS
jgi:predicted MFS family arabinose efflux permease